MKWTKVIIYFFLACFILLADAALKAYVHYNILPVHLSSSLYPFGGIEVFRHWHGIDFSIVHVVNKGAAWGIFATMHHYLLYGRILIIGGLLSYLFFVKASAFRKLCLILITAGAVGNVLDSFIYGHVIDMFYFIFWGYSYPVFNIADSAIFCGIALLVIEALFNKVKYKAVNKNARGSV